VRRGSSGSIDKRVHHVRDRQPRHNPARRRPREPGRRPYRARDSVERSVAVVALVSRRRRRLLTDRDRVGSVGSGRNLGRMVSGRSHATGWSRSGGRRDRGGRHDRPNDRRWARASARCRHAGGQRPPANAEPQCAAGPPQSDRSPAGCRGGRAPAGVGAVPPIGNAQSNGRGAGAARMVRARLVNFWHRHHAARGARTDR
jgi:hypothetical protein